MQENQGQRDYFGMGSSPARSIASNAMIDPNLDSPSRLPGLPLRGKNTLADQIYNYDSIYNVFGRHYSRRYVNKSPKPKLIFDEPHSQQAYLNSYASVGPPSRAPLSAQRSASISPGRFQKGQSTTNLPVRNQSNRAALPDPASFRKVEARSAQKIKAVAPPQPVLKTQAEVVQRVDQSQESGLLLNHAGAAERAGGSRNHVAFSAVEPQRNLQPLHNPVAGQSVSSPNYIPYNSVHKKSQTIDYNPSSLHKNYGSVGGERGAEVMNALDSQIRNYQRLQDNLRSMRSNKQMMVEYGVDKRGRDDRLSHFGQFLIKH